MCKLKKINAIKKYKNIKYMLDAGSEALHNPIAMFDTDYSLTAYSGIVTDDPVWNELISTGTLGSETRKFFTGAYFTFTVADADKLVILKSDKLKYDRVLACVYGRDHAKVALLMMVECNVLSGVGELTAFQAFADRISRMIRDDVSDSSRNPKTNITTLSGDIGDTERPFQSHPRRSGGDV